MNDFDYHTVAARAKERGVKINPVQTALNDVPPDILELLCMKCPVLADGRKRDERIGRWVRETVEQSVDFDLWQIEKESAMPGVDDLEDPEEMCGNPAYDLVAADRRRGMG